jgi:hypothetical protein
LKQLHVSQAKADLALLASNHGWRIWKTSVMVVVVIDQCPNKEPTKEDPRSATLNTHLPTPGILYELLVFNLAKTSSATGSLQNSIGLCVSGVGTPKCPVLAGTFRGEGLEHAQRGYQNQYFIK